MRVNFYCTVNHTGVGRFAENFCNAVALNAPAEISFQHIIPNDQTTIAHLLEQGSDEDVTFFFPIQIPDFVQQVKGKKIYWFVFETNKIASSILQRLKVYDEIWVPSQWAYDVLMVHGLPSTKVRVLSEGVNIQLYHPAPITHKGFVFLSVGKYEKRKCIDEMIEAFVAEFPAHKYRDVHLWLKSDFPLFPERIEHLKQKTAFDPRIKIMDSDYDEGQLVILYNIADAFLFPSRAEGFGLPGIEALACGIPLLATNYSGQTEYLKTIEGLYCPVDFSMVNIVDPDFDHFYKTIYDNEPYGQWAEPNMASLRSGMRDVYDNKPLWRSRAIQASDIIRQHFDWNAVARRALTTIELCEEID